MSFRKQTRADFRRRIKRVDPAYYRWGESGAARDTTANRPLGSALTGFLWAYLVISVASNRAYLENSLNQGSLGAEYHDMIFAGLSVLLVLSFLALGLHILRFFIKRGGKRRNSGGMLVGALGAMVLVYTPADVWTTGYGMLDDNSRAMLLTASATVDDALPNVDLGNVVLVSSLNR